MPIIECKIVEVCVFRFEEDTPSYLLLHRSMTEPVYPGLWQFVSGSIEDGESAIEAARRELAEETALSPTAFWTVPFVNSFYDPARDAVNLSPLFAAQVKPGSIPKLSAEHDEFLWCGYAAARRMLVWPGQRNGLAMVHEYVARGSEAADRTRTTP